MKLQRELGFWEVFCIASGAMISSGLFILPGLAFAQAGPAVVISYALAGVMVIPAMLSKAELVSAMPKSGGSYFFIARSMGPLPGTLAGLANWFSIALKSAFALVGIGAFAKLIVPNIPAASVDWTIKLIAIACCLFFMALNILSVKLAARFQIIMVAGLFVVLAVFVFFGLPAARHDNLAGFMDKGFGAVLAPTGLVFISYGGLTKVASLGGEVRNPGRNLPAGMFAASLVVTLFYVAAVFVTVGVLPTGELAGSLTPLSLAAGKFLGPAGMILLSAGAMLAFITTGNSGILSASRTPMAMSHDGLLPAVFRKLSTRRNTPYVSILVTGGFMIAVIAALTIPNLIKVASTMILMLFALVNLAVLVMRGSKIQNYRPIFRAPLYPWLQLAGVGIYGVLIAKMGTVPLLTTAVFLAAGTLWYFIYVRKRITRESAFVYMVKNIVSKQIYRSDLEEELKQIALERDAVTHDRFDRLIQRCEILDLASAVTSDEMFRQAAEVLSPRLNLDAEHLCELFQQRERQTSTVVQPGLAIPHIVVDGENLFEILLLRCRDGVEFPDQDQPVQVVFMLVGSADERNYHLQALMAIAHITQEHQFVERWLRAPGDEHLRDIVLLSGRRRGEPAG